MKLSRILLALALVATLAGVAYVSQRSDPPATAMAAAAQKFIDSLTPDQKKIALYDFDTKERTNWHFVPLQDKDKNPTRKGLRLQEMTAEQKEAARALVRTGTSASGYTQAITIMSLESILNDLEKPKGTNVRDPNWYFF